VSGVLYRPWNPPPHPVRIAPLLTWFNVPPNTSVAQGLPLVLWDVHTTHGLMRMMRLYPAPCSPPRHTLTLSHLNSIPYPTITAQLHTFKEIADIEQTQHAWNRLYILPTTLSTSNHACNILCSNHLPMLDTKHSAQSKHTFKQVMNPAPLLCNVQHTMAWHDCGSHASHAVLPHDDVGRAQCANAHFKHNSPTTGP